LRSIDALMSQLRELDITLSVRDEQLRCRAPKGILNPKLTEELSARKADILQYLKRAETLTSGDDDAMLPAPPDQALLLSSGQQRLWFLDRLEGPSATYTMPLAVRLNGTLNVGALERALVEIIRRHQVLRTNFIMRDQQPVLQIHEAADNCLTRRALDGPLPDSPAEQESIESELCGSGGHRILEARKARLTRDAASLEARWMELGTALDEAAAQEPV